VGSTQDEEEGHSSAVKTPGQLIAVLVAAFVLPVVILLMIGRLAVITSSTNQDSPAFSIEAVAKRLKPVGRLVIAGDSSATQSEEAPAQPASAPAPTSVAGTVSATDTGDPADKAKAIYAASCVACHTTGAAGAPKLGDTVAWAPRIKAGKEALYNSALKGKNAMPPKGGNGSLSDAEVKAVVDYMINQSK
jgi:cytochrome c5